MNILSVTPKSAAVLELMHAAKQERDEQGRFTSDGGGGGGGQSDRDDDVSSAVDAHAAAQDLETQRMDTQMALEQARDAGEVPEAILDMFEDNLDAAEDELTNAMSSADTAAELYEKGDFIGGDALMRDAERSMAEARFAMNIVREEVGLSRLKKSVMMNILNVVPKTAGLIEAIYAAKQERDEQGRFTSDGGGGGGGGGGSGTASVANMERASEAMGEVDGLMGAADEIGETVMALAEAGGIDTEDEVAYQEQVENAADKLEDADGDFEGALLAYEAGDVPGGDALMRDGEQKVRDAVSELNSVSREVGGPRVER